jgi:hypothetical protein
VAFDQQTDARTLIAQDKNKWCGKRKCPRRDLGLLIGAHDPNPKCFSRSRLWERLATSAANMFKPPAAAFVTVAVMPTARRAGDHPYAKRRG